MDVRNTIIFKFVEFALELCECLPLYFSKYSRKDFTVHQLVVLLVLKQKLKCSYSALIDCLKTMPSIVNVLGLKRIPDNSTLKKFSKRLKARILYFLLEDASSKIKKKHLRLAIDATGLHLEDGSFHYRKRLGMSSKTRKNIKMSVAIDTQTQLITAVKLRKNPAGDNKDFITLVKKSAKTKPIKIVVADKGYDAEKNHIFCNEIINAECIIPVRNKTNKKYRTKGKYRKKLKHGYNKKKYHQRSKIETVFFVIKRIFGTTILSKKWHTQKIELLCKIIAYNAYRLTKLRMSP